MKFTRKISRFVLLLAILSCLVAVAAQAASPNLMAAFFVKGKVGLKWSAMAGVEEYLIFRKAPGEDFQQIGKTSEDRYFDTTVSSGTTYAYKIAIVEGGNQVFSGQKSVSIPGACSVTIGTGSGRSCKSL